MNNIDSAAPWLRFYGEVPHHLQYPDCSMTERIGQTVEKYPDYIAYTFMGRSTTYREFWRGMQEVARAFAAMGIKKGDHVTVCMPNAPQTVLSFYALNYIGAIANMIHPLSGENEIAFYLNDSHSVAAVTLDQFYGKFASIRQDAPELKKLLLTSVADALSPLMKIGYKLTEGRKVKPVPKDADVIWWKSFLAAGKGRPDPFVSQKGGDPAVVLYSGGTTGKTKGILLSNLNFNALALQTIAMGHGFQPGDRALSVMPMFHGFGLGVSIHTILTLGGCCLLIPRFNADSYAQLLMKERPNVIAGVPTLFEALLRNESMEDCDLSCLKGVFSGGDSLSVELKKKFDAFLADHGAKVRIREGYGTTECVTASCLTPYNKEKEGSIGLPFPDTYYTITKPGTNDPVPYGEEGEICLRGPSVMLEYVGQPEETADTLRRHADGYTWLHTGDLGVMDEDGFLYFRQRIKRMIVTSGYNVYPSQLENVIDAHPKVRMSCVIGVPDAYKMQKVKAFVVLQAGVEPSQEVRDELMAHCRRNIARYAMPYMIEFRDQLPKTLVGKVAYKELEAEELAKIRAEEAAKAAPSAQEAFEPAEEEEFAQPQTR